jgi:mannosyltransferase
LEAEGWKSSGAGWQRHAGALALLALALLLRWPGLTESIWYDEWCRTGAVLNAANLRQILLHDVHNPAYNALMYLWISLFGDSELSIRAPSLIAGLGSLAVLCRWIARRLGNERLAWLVAIWGVCSPQHVWFSSEAKNNMLVVAAATGVLIAYSRLADPGAPRRVLWAVLAGAAALWVDWVTLLAIVPGVIWASRQPACRARRSGQIALVTVLLALPLVVLKGRHVDELWRGYLMQFQAREILMLLCSDFLTGNAWALEPARLWIALAAAPAVLTLLVLGGVRLGRSAEGRLVNATFVIGMALIAAAAVVVDTAVSGLHGRIYQPRNLLLLLYPYGIMLLGGAASLPRAWARRAAVALVLGVTLASTVVMVTVHRDRQTVMNPNPDWREVARRIAADGDGAAVVWSRSPVFPIAYYLPRAEVKATWGAPLDPMQIGADAAHGTRVYVVDDRVWWALDPVALAELAGQIRAVRAFSIGGVDVYRVPAAP